MVTLPVKLNEPYNVIIDDSLDGLGSKVKDVLEGETIAIITDSNVAPLYLDSVKTSLVNEGYKVVELVIPAGEKYKNFDTYKQIIEFLANNRLTRKDAVISVGGGVVSDIAGFGASSYLRGISHVIVPTTLLSIIDASIGGKTGFDLDSGKNLVGAFHQPKLVYSAIEVLKTLDSENLISGLGEGIKYGLILGGKCFNILESGLNKDNFIDFITMCVQCKIDIVVADEKEGGLRKLLNLGHTFGHAIEIGSNFTIPHGVAVALGIDKILEYSTLSEKEVNLVKSIIQKYDLYNYKYDSNNLLEYIKMDKKRVKNDSIDLVVLDKIGKCRILTKKIEEL